MAVLVSVGVFSGSSLDVMDILSGGKARAEDARSIRNNASTRPTVDSTITSEYERLNSKLRSLNTEKARLAQTGQRLRDADNQIISQSPSTSHRERATAKRG